MREQHTRKRIDTLDYVHAMLSELRTMAESERCDMLAYLIEMACIEASDVIRGERPLRTRPDTGNSAA